MQRWPSFLREAADRPRRTAAPRRNSPAGRKIEGAIDGQLRGFLGRSYNLKAIADYETDPDASVTQAQAAEAIDEARRFVARIGAMIGR